MKGLPRSLFYAVNADGDRIVDLSPGTTGPTGATGPTGGTGPTGAFGGAISIPYTFSTTTTDSDPGAGNLRLGSATQNTSTRITLDGLANDGTDWGAALATFDDSTSTIKGFIRLVDRAAQSNWLLFSVSAFAAPSGYRNLTVSPVASSAASPFANGASLLLCFTRNGDRANAPGMPWYDVMDPVFGAVGNGIADDTAAINAAIAAANIAPGVIYLGRNHRITAALNPITGNNILIQGRGRFDGGSIISIDAPAGANFIQFEGQYSGIQDVWIRGIGAVYTTGAALRFYGTFQGIGRRLSISDVANGIEIAASTLTKIEEISVVDLYDSYGIKVVGEDPFYSHATWISNSFLSTDFPASVVGTVTDWQTSTAYVAGNVVVANGFAYQCTVGGTSSGSGSGPSGIPGTTTATAHTATITDGTVIWIMAMPLTTWILHDAFADTVRIVDCAMLQGGYGIRMVDTSGGTDYPQFLRCVNLEIDHCINGGIVLSGGRQAEFEQLFVTSMMNGPSITIENTFTGLWRFNGGVIFASGVEPVIISGSHGTMIDMFIGAGGLLAANTYDAVRVDSSVTDFSIENCCIGRYPGTSFPQTRYGISVASGCDNYVIQGNRLVGHDTGPILNTPELSPTRIVCDNIPDSGIVEIEETGAGPFNNYASGGAKHIMCSNAAGIFTGIDATNFKVGDIVTFTHQGSGYTEFQHNTGSSAGNVFFTGRLGKSLRIFDNEIAIFQYLDSVSGASTVTRWELITPQFPFAHASDNANGNVIVHNGTNWLATAGISPTALAVVASNIGVPFQVRVSFSATGATGTLIDVTIWNAAAPFAMRIMSAELLVSTAAGTACALRTASGGGGSVILPDATAATQTFSTAATGHKYDNSTVTATIVANGSLFFNVDRAVAGELILTCVRT